MAPVKTKSESGVMLHEFYVIRCKFCARHTKFEIPFQFVALFFLLSFTKSRIVKAINSLAHAVSKNIMCHKIYCTLYSFYGYLIELRCENWSCFLVATLVDVTFTFIRGAVGCDVLLYSDAHICKYTVCMFVSSSLEVVATVDSIRINHALHFEAAPSCKMFFPEWVMSHLIHMT